MKGSLYKTLQIQLLIVTFPLISSDQVFHFKVMNFSFLPDVGQDGFQRERSRIKKKIMKLFQFVGGGQEEKVSFFTT